MGLAIALAVLLPSCSWTSGDQYFVHWGTHRDDVVIRERTSWDLTLARELFYNNNDAFRQEMGGFRCHANRSWPAASTCVLRLLNGYTSIVGLAGGVWNRGTDYSSAVRRDDFHGAVVAVHGAADDDLQVAPCLTLSITKWIGFNWTTRSRSSSDCRLGKHTWQ